jgi:lipopolysaccharide export system protein LptA
VTRGGAMQSGERLAVWCWRQRGRLRVACVAAVALWLLLGAGVARAAIPEALLNLGQGDDLDLQADEGIEWRQKEQRYVARGNVVIRKGPVTLRASEVGARYETVNGKTVVQELFADGGFSATTAQESLTGGQAVYNLQNGTFRVTGGPIRLKTPDQQASADTSLEYAMATRTVIARGNAMVTQDGNTLRADTLTLLLQPQGGAAGKPAKAASGGMPGKMTLRRADAVGNVLITTPQESLSGQSGFYDAEAGVVRINNKVVLRRGGHQLAGSDAEVNLKTGVSTLENRNPADGGRVRGVLRVDELAGEKKNKDTAGETPQP